MNLSFIWDSAKFHGSHEWPTRVPFMDHMWAATNGTHLSMQQFSTWYSCVLPLKGPTWDPDEAHLCCHLYCPCWANVWLPLWGHTWAATHGAHWSMQQFSTWYPCVLLLKWPTWAHMKPMCVCHRFCPFCLYSVYTHLLHYLRIIGFQSSKSSYT